MSGGYFDYRDHHFNEIANDIQQAIDDNRKPFGDEWSDKYFHENGDRRYSDETISYFKKGLKLIRKAAVYAKAIDYLLCGDDSEETMKERIEEDIAEWIKKGWKENLENDED